MEFLKELIEKRTATMESDIVAGRFNSEDDLEQEIKRLSNVMTSQSLLKGINRAEAKKYIEDNFVPQIRTMYEENKKASTIVAPFNYSFADVQQEIERLIDEERLEEAREKINDVLEVLYDDEVVRDAIADGIYDESSVDFFKTMAPKFEEQIQEKEEEIRQRKMANAQVQPQPEMRFRDRLKAGFAFIAKGKNPYDNQVVEIESEELEEEEKVSLKDRFKGFVSKHKGKIAIGAAVGMLLGGIAIGRHLHNKAGEEEILASTVDVLDDETPQFEETVEMATFEVDEYHNFNVNDEQTHIEKLNLLAQDFMKRGVPVVSDEECMRLKNEEKIATSMSELDNFLIVMNLEDMSDLTFTKLLADTNTDKEELTSDYVHVCNLLGSIYTTKEENPFIYGYVADKEYSDYIKSYEEAIIQNQHENKEDLTKLINSRVYNPVAGTSNGSISFLTDSLIFQQANVYNAQVVGQDVMDLYNINNDCKTDNTTTFYSDDWAELMRKVNSKFAAAIAYTGSEKETYFDYLKTLTDEQDDNKLYIEGQALNYFNEANVALGEWDVIDWIENNRAISYQGTGSSRTSGTTTIKTPVNTATTTVREVPKEPTTPEEIATATAIEDALEEENEESLVEVVEDYADTTGGETFVDPDTGTLGIRYTDPVIPGDETSIPQDITINPNGGEYDSTNDYTGVVFAGYSDMANWLNGVSDPTLPIKPATPAEILSGTSTIPGPNIEPPKTVVDPISNEEFTNTLETPIVRDIFPINEFGNPEEPVRSGIVVGESPIQITNPIQEVTGQNGVTIKSGVELDNNGNIIDINGDPVIHGTSAFVDDYIANHPIQSDWHVVDDGEDNITYSPITDGVPSLDGTGVTSMGNETTVIQTPPVDDQTVIQSGKGEENQGFVNGGITSPSDNTLNNGQSLTELPNSEVKIPSMSVPDAGVNVPSTNVPDTGVNVPSTSVPDTGVNVPSTSVPDTGVNVPSTGVSDTEINVPSTTVPDAGMDIPSTDIGSNQGSNIGGDINPDNGSSIPDGVDEDVYNGLTPEEQAELNSILNAGREPVAGEIVDESYSNIVYGNYTVTQLMNNPALCVNVPESLLKSDFPEIWKVYQNWLEQQKLAQQPEMNSISENEAQVFSTEAAPAVEPVTESVTNYSEQIGQLEAERASLTGEEAITEENVMTR